MNRTKKLTIMAMLIAIGLVASQFIWFPAGVARAYPVQHAVNVIAAVLLGTGPAVLIAFAIGLLRNLLGLGTILAFPGGLVGALFAGLAYRWTKKRSSAVAGEIVGTSVIGALLAAPIAWYFLGHPGGVFFFVPGFFVSSVAGGLIAWFLLSRLQPRLERNTQ
ncbi:energy coupling factor transporter S component ThiW [Salisediminibacterium halotolerans]|uniref:Energy coupling factor transporter S component ThiW n=1 Tax=Salisediminibacterium halotolerans TaxID=517425 RepID=A0A1H9SJ74_9BACI|nr:MULTISPECIES: energy coupling factor transporter S component ThiW [Salisediminibacterium]RLJ73238.1 energy coupling factor transporter S component ThiW [Actinophytocola xinjiangensis]RPE86660.1 energy coupling factor transporter S component ThiW [Salisediminibacterium halotolerans]TWG34035.1 energy coupling factor transporter S component ThiW [Salisediminibacterium halotolerans]SER85086.1 energy coupling factor transporter S component ThiW [Salisediminibacterium haloalkalitolerans]GEL08308.